MSKGKNTCRILRDIRRQIAEANDIEYITSECQYKGDCTGTCPKCEAEVRYLEKQLEHKRMAGKTITVIGLSAGMLTMNACGNTTKTEQKINDSIIEASYQPNKDISTDCRDSTFHDTLPPKCPPVTAQTNVTTQSNDTVLPALPDDVDYAPKEIEGMPPLEEEPIEGEAPFEVIESMPEYRYGGSKGLMEYIYKNLQYPDADIEGRVVVKFTVKKNGNIADAIILKSLAPRFDDEVLRVIYSMPKWKPGTQRGKPVDVRCTIPVTFKLASHK